MDEKDYNEYPPIDEGDIDESHIAVKNANDTESNDVVNWDGKQKKNNRLKKDFKPNIARGKVITKNNRSNMLGVKLNGYGVLVKCVKNKQYSIGDEIKLSHTGVFGNADFRILGIV